MILTDKDDTTEMTHATEMTHTTEMTRRQLHPPRNWNLEPRMKVLSKKVERPIKLVLNIFNFKKDIIGKTILGKRNFVYQ